MSNSVNKSLSKSPSSIPLIIAGPILRHVSQTTFSLWLVTSKNLKLNDKQVRLKLYDTNLATLSIEQEQVEHEQVAVGSRCFIHTIVLEQEDLFKYNNLYYYDIDILQGEKSHSLSALLPAHLYEGQNYFNFRCVKKLKKVLHGSCRKAHFGGDDALKQVDKQIEKSLHTKLPDTRPDLMLFTGDQVYIDDVAGPMLHSIHQVVSSLGLFHEDFTGSTIQNSHELLSHQDSFYQRERLLPKSDETKDVGKAFFTGKKKPVFTSVNASNHLIALNEMLALYILSWSSTLWSSIDLNKTDLADEYQATYLDEQERIENFVKDLPMVERAMAHMPIYMIFDDHDVTDDWNLTRAWEEQIYSHPFSKRIIGNALCAYLLCQGMGNPKLTWEDFLPSLSKVFANDFSTKQDEFIDELLSYSKWQYQLDTIPPIHVLDTRTQRWRSESNPNKPSGLMDWEGLCELQQQLIGHDSVIMVSAAPVYGVKFIETIQRAFITFGGALMVDAENWMAHRGTASVMLNIFRHINTPPNFIILSGDVHYSFVYDISLRFRRNSPNIVQFTCSGIHNQFPEKLINLFERLNRWLYSYRSPLNWLTKRRNMSIKERKADFSQAPQYIHKGKNKEIVNGTALGLLELDESGKEYKCKLILADGSMVTFTPDI